MKTKILPTGWHLLNNRQGFSLLELLVVISIIGLFSTLLTLRLEGFFSEGALREAAKMITSDIGMLHAKAAYTHLEQQMVFNIDEESYYFIEQENTPTSETTDEKETEYQPVTKKLPKNIDLEDVMLLFGEKMQEGETTLRFFPNGSAQSALIHLKNDKDESFTLEINPLTGRVTIHDTYIEQKTVD